MKPAKSISNIGPSGYSLKRWLGSLLVVFIANTALASQVNITARFLPNANNPNINKFENTTPNSGYCADYPSQCRGGQFSLSIPNATGYTPLVTGQTIGLSVPNSWQSVTITHIDGSTQTVKVRITALGATSHISPSLSSAVDITTAHSNLWNDGHWGYAPIGCASGGLAYGNYSIFIFFWYFNSTNPCVKMPKLSVTPGLYFDNINFMYEILTPNPLEMSMGTYTGQITYTIGPAGDFRFGTATANDSLVTLNFSLSVQHTLRVQFPAGADRLTLQAEGGWQQSLYNGPNFLPKKLIANQTFQQWSSTKFKMQLQCQYPTGNDCGIQNNNGSTTIPVKTMVILPLGLVSNDNQQAVNRYPLSNNTAAIFAPSRYVNNERATLHFEVDQAGIGQMINSGASTFRGNVTIVWDSQI